MEVFRAASTQYPHRNAGVISLAGGCDKPKTHWGAVFRIRHLSHSAGCLQHLGRDEDMLPMHDEVGRTIEGRKEVYYQGAPFNRDVIRATKGVHKTSIKTQIRNKITGNSYNFSVD